MWTEGAGKHLRIYVSENERWQGAPLADAIVRRARDAGLAGATVTRGIAGYGAHHRVHRSHLVEVEAGLPLVVDIVDTAEQIERFLPLLAEMIQEGLATIEDVQMVQYRPGKAGAAPH